MKTRLTNLVVLGICAVAGLALLSGVASATVLDQWLFDAPPGGDNMAAVNEVPGGTVMGEQNTAIAWMNLQTPGGAKYPAGGVFDTTGTIAKSALGDGSRLDGKSAGTVEMWVNPAAGPTNEQYLFANSFALSIQGADGANFAICAQVHTPNGWSNLGFTTTTIAAGSWAHLAATYDGATAKAYLNGTLVGSATATGLLQSSISGASGTNFGTIDNGAGGDARQYRGYIDEIRISDEVLLPGDGSGIGCLAWNASLVTPEPSAVALLVTGMIGLLAYAWKKRR
jgi:hypothetical protein